MSNEINDNSLQPTSLQVEHAQGDERRQWMRFPREPETDYVSILKPTSLAGPVELADESLGGFGLIVTDNNSFSLDQVIELSYAGTVYRARVRHITPRDDGRFTVGVFCG
jgi:hypothetical protein